MDRDTNRHQVVLASPFSPGACTTGGLLALQEAATLCCAGKDKICIRGRAAKGSQHEAERSHRMHCDNAPYAKHPELRCSASRDVREASCISQAEACHGRGRVAESACSRSLAESS